MPLNQAIVLAIVQALTEFLPVSSTAHLALFPWFLHWKDPGLTFDVALHAGTLVAVLIYFRKLWLEMLKAAAGLGDNSDPDVRRNRQLFWYLVVGTLPAAAIGWFFEIAAETGLRQPTVIGAALIIVGLLMWAGEKVKNRSLTLDRVRFRDSILIGLAQAVAIIPGVSRSGITMTVGLFRGMTRETVARFSFLLSAPVIAGAALRKGMEILEGGLPADMIVPLAIGSALAGLVGYLVIAVLLRFLEHGTFKIFIVYRIALGVIVLLLGWGWRHHLG
jgi:undecaprenyl-diphosphatase